MSTSPASYGVSIVFIHIAGSICILTPFLAAPGSTPALLWVLHFPWPLAVPYRRTCRGGQWDRAANAGMLQPRADSGSQTRMRRSKTSLHLLACAHVFNNFWGYPGKAPNHRRLLPSLDQRWRPITPRSGGREPETKQPIPRFSRLYAYLQQVLGLSRQNTKSRSPSAFPRSPIATNHAAFGSPGRYTHLAYTTESSNCQAKSRSAGIRLR